MPSVGANPYLRTKILTASPRELRLMLYDGAIKFCRLARDAIEGKQYESSYNSLMRAQKIVLELSTSLNHTADPQLCSRLSALYTYIYRLLVDANMDRDGKKVDEAIGLLQYERETWSLLMGKLGEGEGGDVDPAGQQVVGAQQTAMSSLSTNA